MGSTSVEVSRAFIKPARVKRPPFVRGQHKQAPDRAGSVGWEAKKALRPEAELQTSEATTSASRWAGVSWLVRARARTYARTHARTHGGRTHAHKARTRPHGHSHACARTGGSTHTSNTRRTLQARSAKPGVDFESYGPTHSKLGACHPQPGLVLSGAPRLRTGASSRESGQ